MYQCSNCGTTMSQPLDRCPKCGVLLSGVKCETCGYIGGKSEFIENNDHCPKCQSIVSIPMSSKPVLTTSTKYEPLPIHTKIKDGVEIKTRACAPTIPQMCVRCGVVLPQSRKSVTKNINVDIFLGTRAEHPEYWNKYLSSSAPVKGGVTISDVAYIPHEFSIIFPLCETCADVETKKKTFGKIRKIIIIISFALSVFIPVLAIVIPSFGRIAFAPVFDPGMSQGSINRYLAALLLSPVIAGVLASSILKWSSPDQGKDIMEAIEGDILWFGQDQYNEAYRFRKDELVYGFLNRSFAEKFRQVNSDILLHNHA